MRRAASSMNSTVARERCWRGDLRGSGGAESAALRVARFMRRSPEVRRARDPGALRQALPGRSHEGKGQTDVPILKMKIVASESTLNSNIPRLIFA